MVVPAIVVTAAVCTRTSVRDLQEKPMLYLSPNTRNYSYSITHELTTHELTIRELTFAGLDALEPCVIKLRVAGISTVLEPTASASATRGFAGFVGGTLGTRDWDRSSRCRSCSVHIGTGKKIYKRNHHAIPHTRSYSYSITHELTFAGLETLVPCVIEVRIAGISTVPEPTTSLNATRESIANIPSAAV